jgi:endonuclease/exonuclease/phosphatase (EEP) superfamily protein YafD
MKWIGLYISYVLFFFSLGSVFFPYLYLFELAISFLPYMLVLHIFLAGYWFSRVIFQRRLLYVLLIVFHIIWFIYFVRLLANFYWQDSISNTWSVSVLYANISKINYNYSWLIHLIESYDPDVVMFVEFADHHGNALKPFLSQKYPYINRTSWSRTFVGSMVFSRYFIDDLADDFVQWVWRYGYFRIDGPIQPYYVYLVHTSSPISLSHYRLRNVQLSSVSKHIKQYDSIRDNNPLLLVGDLNVSPWSYFYRKFVNSGIAMENISRRFPILFTWWLEWFPLFWAHIDHVFARDSDTVQHIEQLIIPGSDHRGYYFVLE